MTWPAFNATLNLLAAALLVTGYVFIRRKRVSVHRAFMVGAFAVSVGFLLSYLGYHSQVGSVRFQGQGWVRSVYLSILLTHTVLAAVVPFLSIVTLWRAVGGNYEKHRRIARWTFPIWLYVSITGVVVYLMLYQLFPGK